MNAIIFRYVKDAELASDISQEAFILAFSRLNQFNQEAKFSPWLCKIAVNKAIEYLRKANKYKKINLEIENIPDSKQIYDLVNRFSTYDACIDSLPEVYQVMFILRYGLEMPYKDISFVTGISLGTIKGTFSRIKNILRENFYSSSEVAENIKQKGNAD